MEIPLTAISLAPATTSCSSPHASIRLRSSTSLLVGRHRTPVVEGAAVPRPRNSSWRLLVGVLQDFVAGAAEAEIAVTSVVELVAIAHDGNGLAGRTMGVGTGWTWRGEVLRV